MNFLKNRLTFALMLCTLSALSMRANYVPYVEDAFLAPAPQELVTLAEKVAALAHFDKNYEVMVPKKPGLEINPVNRYISSGINPVTKNAFIIVNPAWFATLSADAQEFLLARCFATFELGASPSSSAILYWLFILFGLLIFLFSLFLLGKTRLASQKIWVRILIALGIMLASEVIILDRIHQRIAQHFVDQHNTEITNKALKLSGNREAAIQALEAYDAAVKTELKNGEQFWAPYEHLFEKLAKELKNK